MKKNIRQEKILEIISNYNISTQEQLMMKLLESGFDVTQATVSRDIKELNLVKIVASNGEYKYAQNTITEDTKATFTRFDYFFSESIKSVDWAGNTVVLKCHTGMAQAACEVFDGLYWEGVVGTLAGENTIFILVKTPELASDLREKLKKYMK